MNAITLREIVEKSDLSDTPILREIKRLYDENDELREVLGYARDYLLGGLEGCKRCPILETCESMPRCAFPEYFKARTQKYV